jgi:hypothetical protein
LIREGDEKAVLELLRLADREEDAELWDEIVVALEEPPSVNPIRLRRRRAEFLREAGKTPFVISHPRRSGNFFYTQLMRELRRRPNRRSNQIQLGEEIHRYLEQLPEEIPRHRRGEWGWVIEAHRFLWSLAEAARDPVQERRQRRKQRRKQRVRALNQGFSQKLREPWRGKKGRMPGKGEQAW